MNRDKFSASSLWHSSLARFPAFLAGLSACLVIAGFLVLWTQAEYGLWQNKDTRWLKDAGPIYWSDNNGLTVPKSSRPESAISPISGSDAASGNANDSQAVSPYPASIQADNHYRQLEQDLAASLRAIEPIRNARIFLTVAQRPAEKNSASVLVELAPDSALSRQQIRAVMHLVAGAVPMLESHRITLVDQNGRLLHGQELPVTNDTMTGRLIFRENFEDYLNSRIEAVLAPVIGIQGFRTEVDADFDFSGVDRIGSSSPALFNRIVGAAELSTANANSPNDVQAPATAPQPLETGKYRRSRFHQRRFGQTDVSRIPPQPVLRKVSTMILLDSNLAIPAETAQTQKTISQDDVKRLTELVKQAMFFNAERGDQVAMNLLPFKKPVPETPRPELAFWEHRWFFPVLQQFTAALALVLLFFGVMRPLIRQWLVACDAGRSAIPANNPQVISYGDAFQVPDRGLSASRSKEPAVFSVDAETLLQDDMPAAGQQRLDYLKKLVDVSPHAIAEVVKLWLKGKDKDGDRSDQAALLMLSLGAHRAAGVLRYLSPRDVQRLGATMIKVKDLSVSLIDNAAAALIEILKTRRVLVVDKEEYVQSMMHAALGEEKSRSILERISTDVLIKGLERLKWMDSQSISETIGSEHPQIVAILLSVLDPEHAAEVLTTMTEVQRSDLLMRIASMKGVQPSALRELDQVMALQIPADDGRNSTPMGGVEFAAHILNHMDSRFGDMILAEIEDRDRELARAIQDKMLTFEDIACLEPKDIQTLLREISTSQLLVALTGAGEGLQEKIFKNMSRRAVEMLKEDMSLAPEAKPFEVELARKEILNIVKKLADAGELKIRVEENF